MFCVKERFSWPVVSGILVSTLVILLADVMWRTIQASYWTIVILAIVLLLVGNASVVIISSRWTK